jgi:putative multiple sugar transport system substrate-binding protein
MIRRKLVALAAGLATVVGMSACSSEREPLADQTGPVASCRSTEQGAAAAPAATGSSSAAPAPSTGAGGKVGVSMPTKQSERWIADGNNVKTQLEAQGYTVDLQYANNDIPTQVNQIDNLITGGVKLLIIAAIDGTALTSQLQSAASKGIKVISYDRLIRNSPNVDYYATFDNFKVGVQQATSLLVGLGFLKPDGTTAGTSTGPCNIELFAGSPDDNNATFFFNGAMETLKPFIDSGKLVVKSDQKDFQKVAILRWEPATAQARMDNLLSANYTGGAIVHGVLSPYDGLSIGILSALKGAGYGNSARPFPIVTGQDAEVASVKSINANEQYASIFKDTRLLASTTVQMANAILSGREPVINDTKTYDNGTKVVPTNLLQSVIVYKWNYKSVLVDSGYYTAAQVG